MGTIYRAHDAVTGALVAVKVLHARADRERFEREAAALAELDHPGIVRYVAHGAPPGELPFLAMEWLEGEDLERRLERGGALTAAESIALGVRVAHALGALHVRGFVHRDIKPSNLFLEARDLDRVKLVDLGVAYEPGTPQRRTQTGVTLGTPGYMAPEQARGERAVDGRADVFSLGCVLFECITGRPAFAAEHVLAILAKILFEEAPRPSELVRDVPIALDRLVVRLLAKDRQSRPIDGLAVAAELAELVVQVPARTLSLRPAAQLTDDEQRLVSIVILAAAPVAEAPTLAAADATVGFDRIAAVVGAFEGQVELIADGSVVVLLPPIGAATDQAARAASCALELRDAARGSVELGEPDIAVATGRAQTGARLAVGEAIDRATRLVREAQKSRRGQPPHPSRAPAAPREIWIDAVTDGLLDERFQRTPRGDGAVLAARREVDSARTLLGKPTPCVGREAELGLLDSLVTQSIDESVARAAIVSGPAGAGKSRLRYELLRRVRASRERVEVWLARADPVGAGSAFGMAAQAIRLAAGIEGGEPLAVRREKIRARVARHVPPEAQSRVTDYLGEMIGAPFTDEGNVALQAARRDAILMGDQIRRAWEDFVDAECAAHPLVLVLEDLHWGDRPTADLCDAVLRLSAERPLVVVAFARPEVDSLMPGLWKERHPTRVSLAPLSRKAAQRLVRVALGDAVADTAVARILDHAAGNAFYLEELIRFEAEARGGSAPETVLGMVEARLAALGPEARRLLRAASVFGVAFWAAGAHALVGNDVSMAETSHRLETLARSEIVDRHGASRLMGQTEYSFQHALVREAAYGMLTDEDRALGHLLAAEWLEAAGEADAIVLAEHFERGGERARAALAFERAAEHALEGHDFEGAIARAERGLACGPVDERLGSLLALHAEAYSWCGDVAEVARSAGLAIQRLLPGSDRWSEAAAHLAFASRELGDAATVSAISAELETLVRRSDPTIGLLMSGARVSTLARQAASASRGRALLGAVEGAIGQNAIDPVLRARLAEARAAMAIYDGDEAAFIELESATAAAFDEAGYARHACVARSHVGYGLVELGAFPEGQLVLERAIEEANRMGLRAVAATARHNLGWALARQGRLDDARRMEIDAAEW